jgi:hypothetical protein
MKTTVASRRGVMTVHSRVGTVRPDALRNVAQWRPHFGPKKCEKFPPCSLYGYTGLYRMCNPVVNFFFWEEDGEATRRQVATGRDRDATGPPSGG